MNVRTVVRSAPGKIILCGEHSVVYGQPALAVPVSSLRAHARVEPTAPGTGCTIRAVDLGQTLPLRALSREQPLGLIVMLVLEALQAPEPDLELNLTSDLPVGGGMGSSAAVAAAAIQALGSALGREFTPAEVSAMTYEVERLHHGTPSGIDNTVIAWEKAIFFIRGQPPEPLNVVTPVILLIADTGVAASTRHAVELVHRRLEQSPHKVRSILNHMGELAHQARTALERGQLKELGKLMNQNQSLLAELGVSHPRLDALVQAARDAGALGAKLTGAGLGGNMIALVEKKTLSAVRAALNEAGAKAVWQTAIEANPQHDRDS